MDEFRAAHVADILNKSNSDISKALKVLDAEDDAFFGLTLNPEAEKRCILLNNICHQMEVVGDKKVSYLPSSISERSRNYLAIIRMKPLSVFTDNRVALLLSKALRQCDDFSVSTDEKTGVVTFGFGIRDVWSDWELDPDRGEKFRSFGK